MTGLKPWDLKNGGIASRPPSTLRKRWGEEVDNERKGADRKVRE